MNNLVDMWCKKYEEFLEGCAKSEDECEDLAAQCADDYVAALMSEKADYEYEMSKEDV